MKNKFKSIIPYLLIVILIGWFSKKFFIERKTTVNSSMALDWDQLDATSGTVPQKTPATLKTIEGATHMREHSTLSKEDEDQFEMFDHMEKAWLAEVESIIGVTHFPRYLEMRESNEKEKMMAYQEYHDFLRQKFGDKFEYNISEDQSIREKKINQTYLKDLLLLVGKNKFQTYIKARDRINEENRRNNNTFIQIEF